LTFFRAQTPICTGSFAKSVSPKWYYYHGVGSPAARNIKRRLYGYTDVTSSLMNLVLWHMHGNPSSCGRLGCAAGRWITPDLSLRG